MKKVSGLKTTIIALSTIFSMVVMAPVYMNSMQAVAETHAPSYEEIWSPDGLEKYDTVIDQIRDAVAEGDNGPEEIRDAFIYKETPDADGEVVEFPGVLEDEDAAFIHDARKRILGDKFADAVTDRQVDQIIDQMHASRNNHKDQTKLLFLVLLGTAALTWMISVAMKQLWEHEKQMKREDRSRRDQQKPQI